MSSRGVPLILIRPLADFSIRLSDFRRVVFPAPFGPRMATRSPRAIEKVMSLRMVREPFNREKPITSMAGSLMKGLRVDGPGHFFEEVDHPRAGDDDVALRN